MSWRTLAVVNDKRNADTDLVPRPASGQKNRTWVSRTATQVSPALLKSNLFAMFYTSWLSRRAFHRVGAALSACFKGYYWGDLWIKLLRVYDLLSRYDVWPCHLCYTDGDV